MKKRKGNPIFFSYIYINKVWRKLITNGFKFNNVET